VALDTSVNIYHPFLYYVHFLYLHKENEPKESAADHLVPHNGTTLCCLQRTGDFGKSHPLAGVLRRVAVPLFAALLGCVKRQKSYLLGIKPVLCR
jgi:hypothetical protein